MDIYQERLVESWNPDYTGENTIQNQTESVTNMSPPGLYEQVINTALKRKLSVIPNARSPLYPLTRRKRLNPLNEYLAKIVQKYLVNVLHNGGAFSTQVELTNQIVALIQNITQKVDFSTLGVGQRVEQFFAPLHEQNPQLATEKTLPAGPSENLHCSELHVFRSHS